MSATTGNRYASFGRIFRVEQVPPSNQWFATGHARGMRPMFLDRLGSRPTREAMQATLDCWARSRGIKPITHEERNTNHAQHAHA